MDKAFVLAAADIENVDSNSNNIIFSNKDTELYVPAVTLSTKDNEKPSKLLSKGFEKSVDWDEYKM